MSEISLGTLYEFNKQAMANEKILTEYELDNKLREASKTIAEKEYWMLLNNERKDYSVFKIKNPNNIVSELYETLTNRGNVISVDKLEDGNFEIWIRDFNTSECFVYYLFDYTFGIIVC